MTFSTEWEHVYQNEEQLAIWPWTQVVSMVMRHTPLKKEPLNVLEVGCGAGANLPFFLANTPNVFAIDGSETIIQQLKQRYPAIKSNFKAADFCKKIPFEQEFDIIIDRAASTHNSSQGIRKFLTLAKQQLTKNGKLIIVDWFSTEFSDFKFGESMPKDNYTKHNFTQGTFQGLGRVHMFDEAHIHELVDPEFNIEHLEHTANTLYSENKRKTASWNLVLAPK